MGVGTIGEWSDIYALGQVIYYILHAKSLSLMPNDDFNDWLDFELDTLKCQHDANVYSKLFKKLLAFNFKLRSRNLNEVISILETLKRSIA